jgi:hypothetical protein
MPTGAAPHGKACTVVLQMLNANGPQDKSHVPVALKDQRFKQGWELVGQLAHQRLPRA